MMSNLKSKGRIIISDLVPFALWVCKLDKDATKKGILKGDSKYLNLNPKLGDLIINRC